VLGRDGCAGATELEVVVARREGAAGSGFSVGVRGSSSMLIALMSRVRVSSRHQGDVVSCRTYNA
jgi:hypothetical protein